MKVFLARVHSLYAALVFCISSIFFLLPQILLAHKKSWHGAALRFNRPWAYVYFTLIGLKIRVKKSPAFDRKQPYIICANHFSFLDIPTMPLLGIPFKFIGKSSIAKAPIFGYMFKKIHVTVDRSTMKGRADSFKKAKEELTHGFSMCFFPEGGIKSESPPAMVSFRDGAFRLAVELQLPILPVVMHSNYKILADDGKFLVFRHPILIEILEPIFPTSQDETEITRLKVLTHRKISEALSKASID
jgi:1-acyl-sn-glycerol-3-phosphate acyltransferase